MVGGVGAATEVLYWAEVEEESNTGQVSDGWLSVPAALVGGVQGLED